MVPHSMVLLPSKSRALVRTQKISIPISGLFSTAQVPYDVNLRYLISTSQIRQRCSLRSVLKPRPSNDRSNGTGCGRAGGSEAEKLPSPWARAEPAALIGLRSRFELVMSVLSFVNLWGGQWDLRFAIFGRTFSAAGVRCSGSSRSIQGMEKHSSAR